MHRIHIVGVSPRTGTTLLSENMVCGFRIDAFEEHEAPLARCRRDVNLYLTKTPGDLSIVGPRLLTDRRFHVICMMRDPRDVIVSRHALRPQQYWVPLSVWKQRVRLVRALSPLDRFLVLRYEDMVSDPDAVQKTISERMPFLVQTNPFSAFHSAANPSASATRALGGVRPIDTARVGNWRNHLPRVAGQVLRHGPVTSELVEFAYENGDEWLTALEGVEPDMSDSYWPENQRRWRAPWRSNLARGYYAAGRVLCARGLGVRLV
jgi:hypothetical protein